jgi:hypothetical protein
LDVLEANPITLKTYAKETRKGIEKIERASKGISPTLQLKPS